MNYASLFRFAVAGTVALLSAASHGAPLNEAQARAYFAQATISTSGSLDGQPEFVVLIPNPGKATLRLEVWRKTPAGYELVASAPKAGCEDCSGPTRKNNPTRLTIDNGALHVEYQGGSGLGYWAWRSSWSWDPVMGALRVLATQRIGADEQGDARHSVVNFVAGTRAQQLKSVGPTKQTECRAAITRQPVFADLSLSALFDGTLEPDCQSGTDVGDALAATPAPGVGALGHMMRASPSKPDKITNP